MDIKSIKSKKDLTKRMNDFGFFASDLLQEMEPDKILFENDGVFVRFSHWEEVSEFLKTKEDYMKFLKTKEEDYMKQEKMLWEYVEYLEKNGYKFLGKQDPGYVVFQGKYNTEYFFSENFEIQNFVERIKENKVPGEIERRGNLVKKMESVGYKYIESIFECIAFYAEMENLRFSRWEDLEKWLDTNYISMQEANMSGKRMVTCVECGKVFEIGSCIELDGEYICKECTDEHCVPCYECGGMVRKYNAERIDGKYICEDCVDELYVECEGCGEYVRKNNATYVDSECGYICDYCLDSDYFKCEECGGYFRNEDDCGWPNLFLCEGCYNDMYVTCEVCGDVILREDCFSDGYGNVYCETCWDERGGDISQYVREYHDGPELIQKGYPKNNRFFGIEQETDGYNDIIEAAEKLSELSYNDIEFWMEKDGSLVDGIEIITHPMSLGYALEEYPWEEIHDIVVESGGSAHDNSTCGMHVHVSKDSLGDNDYEIAATVSKMLYLVEKHWDEWVKFSRRDEHSMKRWCQKNEDTRLEEINTPEKCVEKYYKERGNGRYHAINCTNCSTIEFRIFRGTLNVNTIKATLQMLNNFCDVCLKTPIEEIQGVNFKDYACGTPEIEKYLKERGLN